MKYKTITAELLKAIRRNGRSPLYTTDDEFVYITSYGCVLYKIPIDKIEINLNRCNICLNGNDLKDHLSATAFPAEPTGKESQCEAGTAIELSDGFSNAWYNKDLIKAFDKPGFAITGSKRPILIYEKDIVVGCVLPLREELLLI